MGPTTDKIVFWPSMEFAAPSYGILPADGQRPKLSLKAAGTRILPPISVPNLAGEPRSAISAPSPPELPPLERCRFLGFHVYPIILLAVSPAIRVMGTLVLQNTTAPARQSSSTSSLSAVLGRGSSFLPSNVSDPAHITHGSLNALHMKLVFETYGKPMQRTHGLSRRAEIRIKLLRHLYGIFEKHLMQAIDLRGQDSSSVTSTCMLAILALGNFTRICWISFCAFSGFAFRIMRPPRPCSRSASQQYRPSVPAPPVTTAFPWTINLLCRPFAGSLFSPGRGAGDMDAWLPSLRIMLGTARAARTSRPGSSAEGAIVTGKKSRGCCL